MMKCAVTITLLMFAAALNAAYSQGASAPAGNTGASSSVIKIPIGNKVKYSSDNNVYLFSNADKPSAKLVTDKPKYKPGKKVSFTFTVINDKQKTYRYNFSSSKQFDIVVTNNIDKIVWRLSSVSSYTPAITAFDLKPGQGKVYTAVWTLPADIKPGIYNVQAVLTPQIRPAIREGVIVSPDNDPNNIGMPTRTNTETGAAIQVNTVAPATAAARLVIVPKA